MRRGRPIWGCGAPTTTRLLRRQASGCRWAGEIAGPIGGLEHQAIRNFRLRYDEVVAKLNLGQTLSDEDLLKHFDGKPAFQTFRASWSPQDKALFCRLAKAVHSAGLDWWHMGKGIQLRFGRKNPGSERAVGVLGVIRARARASCPGSAGGRRAETEP